MEFKGTKGGWEHRSDTSGNTYYIVTIDQSHKNTFIGEVGGGLQNNNEIKSNAKLIAAAPELLDALQGLLNDFEYYISEQENEPDRAGYMEVARQAINKALGVQ